MRRRLTAIGCLHVIMLASVQAGGAEAAEAEARVFAEEKPLREKERNALQRAEGYREAEQYPYRDGFRTVYLYGAGEATLVCSPLNVCLMDLEPGERIVAGGVQLGDSVRWRVAPVVGGGGGNTVLAVKPVDAGLATTMAVVTDRRTYHLRLVSRRDDYMPAIAWQYPEDAAAAWGAYHAASAERAARETAPETAEPLADLDFEYEISLCGRCPWRPRRVYNDGIRTVIELPADAAEQTAPILLVTDGDAEEIANYRFRGGRYIVDGLFATAMLVAGVGRAQQKVTIRRKRP